MVSAINARVNGVVRTILTNVSYRSAGRPSSFTYGNGAVRQLTYGWDNRLQSISTGALQSLSYGYDANDRMSSIANDYDGSTQTFGYNNVDRLTMGRRHDGQDEYWSYDSIGHRQTHNRGTSGFTLNYQGNWLKGVSGGSVSRSYQIDALGNRTQLTHGGATEGTDFYYDPFQRQRWVVRGTNQTECDTARAGTCPVMTAGLWTYGYNHAGQRTYRSDHSPPSRFQLRRGTDYFSRDSLRTTRRWIQRYLHAPSGELLAETAPNSNTDDGAIASVYVYFAGQPVAVIRNGVVNYIYNDHLGRPEVVANSTNQPVWRAKNYAFHREVMQQGGSFGALNLGFPGQYYDAETNLYYNWHRYYDPSTGRYTQADPIGLMGGVNTYGYVGGNPIAAIDRNGLYTCVLTTVGPMGVRDHAAVYTSRGDGSGGRALYDPAGSYGAANGGGSSGLVIGEAANVSKFAEFHKKQQVEVTCKNTSREEEESVINKAMDLPAAGPFQCAEMSSTALSGHPSFPNVQAGTF
ncbi:RHS repeat-associated core domain-containing protein [Pseudoxanthomonas sp. CAU 1598]|uniref:RHS repeat-associated core domain-containing protein n=2 Tax=Pseudomarimonas arenosa TaxID=2774145 RepID=A0AAW3ZW56_9GAMM|nr:RHS repeat-associated core domain-containing protein [Pseudomarimonas arenosa]